MKYNLPNEIGGGANNLTAEYSKFKELNDKVNRTITGQESFASSSSSENYNTIDYISDNTIYNKGEDGLLNLLKNVLKEYIISADDFNKLLEESEFDGILSDIDAELTHIETVLSIAPNVLPHIDNPHIGYNLPNEVGGGVNNLTNEYAKMQELSNKVNRTITGQESFISSSSNIEYNTEDYINNDSIYNNGENGLLNLLKDTLANYIIDANLFNKLFTKTKFDKQLLSVNKELANMEAVLDIDNNALQNVGKFYDLFDNTNNYSQGQYDETLDYVTTATAGQTSVIVGNGSQSGFATGNVVKIQDDENNYEYITINNVVSNTIHFKTQLQNNYTDAIIFRSNAKIEDDKVYVGGIYVGDNSIDSLSVISGNISYPVSVGTDLYAVNYSSKIVYRYNGSSWVDTGYTVHAGISTDAPLIGDETYIWYITGDNNTYKFNPSDGINTMINNHGGGLNDNPHYIGIDNSYIYYISENSGEAQMYRVNKSTGSEVHSYDIFTQDSYMTPKQFISVYSGRLYWVGRDSTGEYKIQSMNTSVSNQTQVIEYNLTANAIDYDLGSAFYNYFEPNKIYFSGTSNNLKYYNIDTKTIHDTEFGDFGQSPTKLSTLWKNSLVMGTGTTTFKKFNYQQLKEELLTSDLIYNITGSNIVDIATWIYYIVSSGLTVSLEASIVGSSEDENFETMITTITDLTDMKEIEGLYSSLSAGDKITLRIKISRTSTSDNPYLTKVLGALGD